MTLPLNAQNLKLDADGDITLENGNLAFVADAEALEQKIDCALALFQGEWFLDETVGVPYFQSILGKGRSLSVIREIFRTQLLAIRGVDEVLSLTVSQDRSARTVTVDWTVSSDLGELTGEVTA